MTDKADMGTADPFARPPEPKLEDALARFERAVRDRIKRQRFATTRKVEGTKAAEEEAA